jgi:NADH-quinone oxidoreductase subunit M
MLFILSIEFLLILSFTVIDLFFFCFFFEALIFPMFFIILEWGNRERRIRAITYFYMYTMFGSIFLFIALFMVFLEVNSLNFIALRSSLLVVRFSEMTDSNSLNSILICFFFFIVFAIKIPMFPFYI